MLRVYLDNDAASGRVLSNLHPSKPEEQQALNLIEAAHHAGKLKRVTSRESWREQERTADPEKRATLEAARAEVSVVAADHILLGFSTNRMPYGTLTSSPIISDIVDESLFSDLKGLGLKDGDARHLMYAVTNKCDRFITTDPHFHDRRSDLERRCGGIRIMRPSELATELGLQ